jgi:hypothetical protein
MKPTTNTPCTATKPDGSPCQAAALPDSPYCFFHDPTKAAARRRAQSSGGQANRMRTLPPDVPDVRVADCRDVVALLGDTINEVRKGLIDPRIANTVGYLAGVLVRIC